MNKIKYLILSVIALSVFSSCEDDSADNPAFGSDDIPAIYSTVAWTDGVTVKYENKLSIQPQVSPSDGATYEWSIDGVVVSTEKDIDRVMDTPGIYTLKFTAERNGVSNSRTTQLIVYKDFVPKTAVKKSVGYLTIEGSLSDIPWSDITHLVVSSNVVAATGLPDYSPMEKKIDLDNLIIIAHNYGVYVMVEYSGLINYINAVPGYLANSFYTAAVTPDTRSTLISNITDYAKAKKLDGVNIYMDKATDGAYPDPVALKAFYQELAAAVPTKSESGKEFFLTMSVVGGWTNASLAGVVNIQRYNWINVLAFAAEDLVPGPQSAVTYFTGQITQWLNWYGVAPGRIVGMAPAFGLRYFGNPAQYTWGNLWQFTEYIPYKTLCQQYPDAPTKNKIEVDNGIYYDGFPAITEKAQYVTQQSLGGMGIWSVENDSKDPAKSLTKKMNEVLGN